MLLSDALLNVTSLVASVRAQCAATAAQCSISLAAMHGPFVWPLHGHRCTRSVLQRWWPAARRAQRLLAAVPVVHKGATARKAVPYVRIGPAQLVLFTANAIEQEVKQLYCDTVIPNVGLATTVYDILNIEGGDVHIGDGGAAFHVQFRLLVFRPFIGEVLISVRNAVPRPGAASLGAASRHGKIGPGRQVPFLDFDGFEQDLVKRCMTPEPRDFDSTRAMLCSN